MADSQKESTHAHDESHKKAEKADAQRADSQKDHAPSGAKSSSPRVAASTHAQGAVRQAQPVRVDNYTRRAESDGLEGLFVDVVEGEHKGRRGSFEQVLEHDPKDGYPKQILVRTRDSDSLLLTVNYADVRPTEPEYRGGR